jgi:hypothetical protein
MTRHAILGLALLLAMIGDSPGQSQEPSPSSANSGNPPQEQSSPNQQKSAIDLRGTAQFPLIIRSIKSKEEAAQDTRHRQDKASTDGGFSLVLSKAFCRTELTICASAKATCGARCVTNGARDVVRRSRRM